jgi:hypothetical protein
MPGIANNRHIPDPVQRGAECVLLTPNRTGLFVVPARSGLLAPLSDGLDMAKADIVAGISDTSNLRDCGSCLIVRMGGKTEVHRRSNVGFQGMSRRS